MQSNHQQEMAAAAEAVRAAREVERSAQTARLDAEQKLIALASTGAELPTEGTYTERFGALKVSITNKLTRSVDQGELVKVAGQIPDAIGQRLFRWSADVNLRELRFLQSNDPEIAALVSKCITTKPAKPAVSVELAGG